MRLVSRRHEGIGLDKGLLCSCWFSYNMAPNRAMGKKCALPRTTKSHLKNQDLKTSLAGSRISAGAFNSDAKIAVRCIV